MCLFCGKDKDCKCDFSSPSWLLITGSFLGVVLAVIGAMGLDLYLASSQWLLVSLVLATWAIFLKEK